MLPPAGYPIRERLTPPAVAGLTARYPEVMARLAGETPEMRQGAAVRAWDWERPREIDHIMRQIPVGPERRGA